MPFLFKQIHVFEGAGHGWTEVVYFERPTGDVQAAIDFTSDYRNKRRPLLGKQCSFVGQRTLLIQDDAGNPVKRVGLNNFFGSSLPGATTQDAEDTTTSLQIVWSDAQSRYKKNLYMCGAWQVIFPSADTYTPTAGWTNFFNPWRATCLALGFGWRRRVQQASYQISNYTTDNATMITTYTVKSPASIIASFGEKRTVGVEFFNRKSALDGIQVVVPISETAPVNPGDPWTTILKTAAPRPSLPFTTPGQMRLYTYQFVTPAAPAGNQPQGGINAVKPVRHKRGRPLFVSPGRQANRVRA